MPAAGVKQSTIADIASQRPNLALYPTLKQRAACQRVSWRAVGVFYGLFGNPSNTRPGSCRTGDRGRAQTCSRTRCTCSGRQDPTGLPIAAYAITNTFKTLQLTNGKSARNFCPAHTRAHPSEATPRVRPIYALWPIAARGVARVGTPCRQAHGRRSATRVGTPCANSVHAEQPSLPRPAGTVTVLRNYCVEPWRCLPLSPYLAGLHCQRDAAPRALRAAIPHGLILLVVTNCPSCPGTRALAAAWGLRPCLALKAGWIVAICRLHQPFCVLLRTCESQDFD